MYLVINFANKIKGQQKSYYLPVQLTLRNRRFMAALYRGEEVTDRNTGISLLLSIGVWVRLSPTIERRETRPTS